MHLRTIAIVLAGLSFAAAGRNGRLSRRQNGPVDPTTTPDCTYYTDWPQEYLDQGDTCASIASFWGISERAFIIWNPSVGSACTNLVKGNSYCVEENGSTDEPTRTPTPVTPSKSSTASSSSGPIPVTSSSKSSTPVVTASFSRTSSTFSPSVASSTRTGATIPSPTQGGLAADCQRFYLVNSGNYCQGIVDLYGTFSLADFYSWNPAVGTSCGGLQAGYYVCVGVSGTPTAKPTPTPAASTSVDPSKPSPTQGGLIPGCQRFYLVQTNDYCQAIVDQFGTFTLNQFYSWNPAVGDSCGGLQAGYYVCVGVSGTPTTRPSATAAPSPTGPQPQQPNIAKNCQRFHQVQDQENCDIIVNRYRTFTLAQFLAWNPDVGSNCGGLWLGYYVCIGIPGTPTVPPTSTARPTASAAPSPTQSGIPQSCTRYGQAPSGGTCPAFAGTFGISLASLYAWNPVLGRNGENCQTSFWAGYWYCVRA